MKNKQKIYWVCQISGWLFFGIVNLLFNQPSVRTTLGYLLLTIVGIALTQLERFIIIKYRILTINIIYQVVFIVATSLILSTLFCLAGSGFFQLSLEAIINGVVPFIFWAVVYFGFHYLDNYKKTEIENLRWEASSKDIELNKLKSQLNPHFMFNSMNSIRALIDEDPSKAKEAITQLSNILRNTLLMNKNKEILLMEEMQLVKDYLDLEKIRYEERLESYFDIKPETLNLKVPPLIIQTQVENAIKHSISKLPKGGTIRVNSYLTSNNFRIEVINTGQISLEKTETGFGLLNSKQRLELLYGSKAGIEIKNTGNNEVNVEINIPIN